MSDDIVPYYSPLPITRAARAKKALAQQHQAEMDKARSEAEVFEYRTLEAIDIASEYVMGISLLDRNITAACGDRPAFEMEMRSLVPIMNVAFGLGVTRFMRGR